MSTPRKAVSPSISDAAVKRATGRPWAAWFRELDRAGAGRMTHPGIVAALRARYGLSPWWEQMVAVTYEKARGLRDDHQKPDGFQVGCTRTVAVPVDALWRAWHRKDRRRGWLADPDIRVRTATPARSLRADWVDGASRLDVTFTAKGDAKSAVQVTHGKLPDRRAAERMKTYWRAQLDRLKVRLER